MQYVKIWYLNNSVVTTKKVAIQSELLTHDTTEKVISICRNAQIAIINLIAFKVKQ